VIQEAPRVEGHDRRKGNKELKPFITMVSTHMIAILEKDSPLQQAANADSNKVRGFGNTWTSKHGSSFFFVIVLTLSDLPFLQVRSTSLASTTFEWAWRGRDTNKPCAVPYLDLDGDFYRNMNSFRSMEKSQQSSVIYPSVRTIPSSVLWG
jgi:hypothetical protein